MKLESKGPIVKPPVLKGPAQKVSLEIQSWKGIISATHWTIGDSTKVNGADFYVGPKELGHIHLDGELHLVLTKPLAQLLIERDLADAFPYSDAWVQLEITDKYSADLAKWLFKLGYDRLNDVTTPELKKRIIEFS